MAFRKHVMITVALLSICGMLLGCSSSSTTALSPSDSTPLLPPTGVTMTALPNGDIAIDWAANTQPTLRGYNVYRRVHDQAIEKISGSLLTTNRFIDGDPRDNAHNEYWVTTVNSKNVESAFSVSVIYVEPSGNGRGLKFSQ